MANEQFPLVNYHFQVDWKGTKMAFTEVTGLVLEYEVVEYRTGDAKSYYKTRNPGPPKQSNITLKRGTLHGDNELWDWWNSAKLTDIKKRDVTITLLNEEHQPVVTWSVTNAWPVKIQATDLKASGKEVLIETMELSHEGITIKHE